MHGGIKDENTIDFSISVNTLVPDFIKIAFEDVLRYETRYTYVEWIEEDFKKLFGEDCTIVAGATEALQIIGWTIMKDACVLIPLPNYTEYAKIARFSSSQVKTVWILENGRLNLDRLTKHVKDELEKHKKIAVILGNPNNPTGIYEDLNGFLKDLQDYSEKITVIVDEAFVDFVPDNFLRHVDLDKFENVIILRTFTKILGIPGVRIGYVKTKKYNHLFKKYRMLWAIGGSGYMVLEKIVENYHNYKKFIDKTKKYYEDERQKFSHLMAFPSKTNYLTCKIQNENIFRKLIKQENIHVRFMKDFNMSGYIRLGLKSQKDNQLILHLLTNYLGKER